MRILLATLILCLLPTAASAQSVHRCVDATGKVAFTQAGCGTVLKPDQVYDATNVAPSGGSEVVPYGRVPEPRAQSQQSREPRYKVVGPNGSCRATGTQSEAYRNGYPSRGMSIAQVRSMYGAPDQVSASSNGYLRHTWYSTDTLPMRSVSYDENQCVAEVFASQRYNREPERRQPGTRANTVRR